MLQNFWTKSSSSCDILPVLPKSDSKENHKRMQFRSYRVSSTDLCWKKVPIFIFFSDLITRTNIRVQHLTTCKNSCFNQNNKFSVLLSFPRKKFESWWKANCDFETAILHYIVSVERKYILLIGLRREYIFFQLLVNIMQNCRLKIEISFSRYRKMSGSATGRNRLQGAVQSNLFSSPSTHSYLPWNLTLAKKLLVNDKITASWQRTEINFENGSA